MHDIGLDTFIDLVDNSICDGLPKGSFEQRISRELGITYLQDNSRRYTVAEQLIHLRPDFNQPRGSLLVHDHIADFIAIRFPVWFCY